MFSGLFGIPRRTTNLLFLCIQLSSLFKFSGCWSIGSVISKTAIACLSRLGSEYLRPSFAIFFAMSSDVVPCPSTLYWLRSRNCN